MKSRGKFNTLQFRLALWISLSIGLFLIIAGAALFFALRLSLIKAIDDSLALNAAQAELAIDFENGVFDFPEGFDQSAQSRELIARGLSLRLISTSGDIVWSLGPFSDLGIAPDSPNSISIQSLVDPDSGDRVRTLTSPVARDGVTIGAIQVFQSLGIVEEFMDRLLLLLLIGIPLMILTVAAIGFFLAGRTLRPINTITQTAAQISAEDLAARIQPPTLHDEVGRLALAMNSMLERLEAAFKRERQFTAEASHELRTPLASLQAITDFSLQKPRSTKEYEQALSDISSEVGRLQGLTDKLLQLARGKQAAFAETSEVDLSELLTDVVATLKPLADEKKLKLTLSVSETVSVTGNPDALIQLFINLIENAIKYTEKGSVTVNVASRKNMVAVSIADTGIGIPVDHLTSIFDRFHRVDDSRSSPGAGLGLSIARSLAQMHSGSIEVKSQPSKGTTFTVLLPKLT